jgi:hypothetical protein
VLLRRNIRAAFEPDQDYAGAELERGLDRVRQAGGGATLLLVLRRLRHHAVDDHLDRVALVLGELDLLGEVHHLAVDAHAHEAGAARVLEDLLVLALAVLDHGREHHQPPAGGEGEDAVHDLLDGLALDRAAEVRALRVGAVGPAGAGVEQAEVVVDLRDRADGRARVAGGALLVDRDRGGEAVDRVDVRLLHLAEELARVGGERLDVAALPLGVDRVEGERGLAGAGEAGDHDELVAGDGDVDVLEVMLAGAADDDGVERHGGLRCRWANVCATSQYSTRQAAVERVMARAHVRWSLAVERRRDGRRRAMGRGGAAPGAAILPRAAHADNWTFDRRHKPVPDILW